MFSELKKIFNSISKKDKKILIGMGITFFVIFLIFVIQYFYLEHASAAKTEYAFNYVKENKISLTGYAVRDESNIVNGVNQSILLHNSGKVYVPVVGDSENVGVKSVIAYAFDSEANASNFIQLQKLNEQLETLETLKKQTDLGHIGISQLNSVIYASVEDYVDSVSKGDFSEFDSVVNEFIYKMSTKSLAVGKDIGVDAKIADVKAQISALKNGIGNYDSIIAPCAGYFVSNVDGYEGVKLYDDVKNKNISLGEGEKLINSTPQTVENAYGKIITDHDWYFIFDTNITDAQIFITGYSVSVSFPDNGIKNLEMTVYDTSELNGDKVTITLKCTRMTEEIANLRIADAEITVEHYEGYRISSDALTEDENGVIGVYVLEGEYARFTPVSVYYYGENYVIAGIYIPYKTDKKGNQIIDEDKMNNYKEKIELYDEIIVGGVNLEDGKIVS